VTRAAIAVSTALVLAYVDAPGHLPSAPLLRALAIGAPLVAIGLWAVLELTERAAEPVEVAPEAALSSPAGTGGSGG
jgi:hypothetical protein